MIEPANSDETMPFPANVSCVIVPSTPVGAMSVSPAARAHTLASTMASSSPKIVSNGGR